MKKKIIMTLYLKMGMLRLLPAAMWGALMLWQNRMKVMSR